MQSPDCSLTMPHARERPDMVISKVSDATITSYDHKARVLHHCIQDPAMILGDHAQIAAALLIA
jgi:hypothetical protein